MKWIKLGLGLCLVVLVVALALMSACQMNGLMKGPLPSPSRACTPEKYGLGFLTQSDAAYPAALALTILFGAIATWAGFGALQSFLALRKQGSWRTSLRLFGWLYVAASAAAVAVMLIASRNSLRDMEPLTTLRVVESLVPAAIGIHVALACSLDDEPGVEVFLTCSRPFAWITLERVALVFVLHGLVAIVGSLMSMLFQAAPIADLPVMMVRWVAPAVFFAGIGLWATFGTRNAAFGGFMVVAVWAAMVIGFDNLLAHWPFLWPFHAYAQPTLSGYVLNRAVITLFGIFFLVDAIRQLGDEEWILLGSERPGRSALLFRRLALRLNRKSQPVAISSSAAQAESV